MKSDQEIMQSIRTAIDDCTKGIDDAPSLQYQIARKAKGEEPVVRKISTTFILTVAILAITVTALAAGIIYNQNWYYQGSVKDGIRVGYATFIYEDNIYTGGFKDNMCDGYGMLISAGKNQIFMTKFIKGKI